MRETSDPDAMAVLMKRVPRGGWYFEIRFPDHTRTGWAETLEGACQWIAEGQYHNPSVKTHPPLPPWKAWDEDETLAGCQ